MREAVVEGFSTFFECGKERFDGISFAKSFVFKFESKEEECEGVPLASIDYECRFVFTVFKR